MRIARPSSENSVGLDHRLVAEVERAEAQRRVVVKRLVRDAGHGDAPALRVRYAPELRQQLTALGRVADRVARDQCRAGDDAVGEERAAAGREEVALVPAQCEVGEAVRAVPLHERRRALALAALRRRNRVRTQPEPEPAHCQPADEQQRGELDAPGVVVGLVGEQRDQRQRDRERDADLDQRPHRRRVARRDEVAARAEERHEQDEVRRGLLDVEALGEVRDRGSGDD